MAALGGEKPTSIAPTRTTTEENAIEAVENSVGDDYGDIDVETNDTSAAEE